MNIFAEKPPLLTNVLVSCLMSLLHKCSLPAWLWVLSQCISSFTVKTFSLELSSNPSLTQDGKTMLKLMRFGLKNLSLFQNVNLRLLGEITFQYEKGLHLQEQKLNISFSYKG